MSRRAGVSGGFAFMFNVVVVAGIIITVADRHPGLPAAAPHPRGPGRAVLRRDVGALLLLRHARPADLLSDRALPVRRRASPQASTRPTRRWSICCRWSAASSPTAGSAAARRSPSARCCWSPATSPWRSRGRPATETLTYRGHDLRLPRWTAGWTTARSASRSAPAATR